MKKRWISFFLAFLFMVGLLAGCAKKGAITMDKTACLSPLRWGMTESEAEEAWKKAGIAYQRQNASASRVTYRVEGEIMGLPAVGDFRFTDAEGLDVDCGPVLTGVYLTFQQSEPSVVIEKVSAVLGERATHQPHYQRYNGVESIGSTALDEADRKRWYADQNLLDLFEEAVLVEAFGLSEEDLAERSVLERFYQTYLYVVTLHKLEEGGCMLEIGGLPQVYADILSK